MQLPQSRDIDHMVCIDNDKSQTQNMETLLKTKPKIDLPPVDGTTDPVLLARHVRKQRALWNNDYPFRSREYFPEEEIFKLFDRPVLEVKKDEDLKRITKLNPNHPFKRLRCFINYGAWSFKIIEQTDDIITWDISVWNGATFAFHPDECANQILDHHSEEVFNRWRRMARAQYDQVIGPIIKAAKECFPSFACGSVTSCDSSERLMEATPEVIIQNHIAYLIW